MCDIEKPKLFFMSVFRRVLLREECELDKKGRRVTKALAHPPPRRQASSKGAIPHSLEWQSSFCSTRFEDIAHEIIEQVLKQMTPQHKNVIEDILDGKTVKEVAQVRGLKPVTIYAIQARFRQRIARRR